LKANDSRITDSRLKLVNDIVVGIRTIKCYGWENHYLEKITAIRNSQKATIYKFLIIGSLEVSLFEIAAISSIFLILLQKWATGETLDLSKVYSLFACIFVLFMFVNSLTYLGTVALQNFTAILFRYSELMA
jgi:ATP-binding cassette subfamily C (CFTR/MRP) protein 1